MKFDCIPLNGVSMLWPSARRHRTHASPILCSNRGYVNAVSNNVRGYRVFNHLIHDSAYRFPRPHVRSAKAEACEDFEGDGGWTPPSSEYQFVDGRALQTITIPFRVISLNETRTVEVLMVTTAKGNWTFPKGLVDVGLTQDEVAAKEVLEEAGAKGRLLRRQPYRSFCYTKHEWNNTICEVIVYKMYVEDVLPEGHRDWPDDSEGSQEFRKREWIPLSKALQCVSARITGSRSTKVTGFKVARSIAHIDILDTLRELKEFDDSIEFLHIESSLENSQESLETTETTKTEVKMKSKKSKRK